MRGKRQSRNNPKINKSIENMKKLTLILAAAFGILAASCNTGTTEIGYDSAKKGDYVVSYTYVASKTDLTKAVAYALSARKWQASTSPNGFNAEIDRGGVSAKAKITVSDNSVAFDTRGSTAAGKPIVPYRYLDYLNKSILEYLRGQR